MSDLVDLDGILFDLDGTVCLSGAPIGNIVFEINKFVSKPSRIGILVTNNSSKSRDVYARKLDDIGILPNSIAIVTPIVVAADYMKRNGYSHPFILGTTACRQEFSDLEITHEEADPDCVIVAFDTETTYQKLDRCSQLMLRGLPVFQTNIDRFCPTNLGPAPDCGAIQALLTATTGIRPRVHFGKPGRLMVGYLKRTFSLATGRFAMIGDRQSTDVLLGNRLGALSVWVRSGDPAIDPKSRPDRVHKTMDEFLSGCA